MMWNRKELKEKAKNLITNNYWYYVLSTFLFMLLMGIGILNSEVVYDSYMGAFVEINILNFNLIKLTGAVVGFSAILMFILKFFFINVIEVGGCKFYIESSLNRSSLENLFVGFKSNYKNIVYIMFIRDIKLVGWMLLFIIPGIVKSYEYYMIPYLLSENSEMDCKEVFMKSKEMMNNNKWDTFVLSLSFFGWTLLSAITFDLVGIFWLYPYQYVTFAGLYLRLKEYIPQYQ